MKTLTTVMTAAALCGAVGLVSCAQAQAPAEKITEAPSPADETPAVTLPGLSVELDAADPLFIVAPGGENKVGLVVKNSAAAPQNVTLNVRVESYDGSTQEKTATLSVPANGNARWQMPREMLGKLGIKWVYSTLEANGKKADAVKSALAYMNPSGPTATKPGDFIFGIAYGASGDNANPKAARASALAGVKAVRSGENWSRIQPNAGEWKWDSPDKLIAVNSAQNMETQWILSGTVNWAVRPEYKDSKEKGYTLPPQPDAWRTFVAGVANRYKDKARFWEIWNEPDIGFFNGTIEQYLEMQRIAYEEIKKADPRQQVMTGGFTSLQHGKVKKGMLERTLREGNFDVLAYHQHGDFKRFQQEIDEGVLPLMRATGRAGTPLYFTETAQDTRYGERFQAETLVKKLTFAWSRGAIGYTWFNLHDLARAQSPTAPGTTYGLFTNTGDPKADYPTLNNLTRLLRGKKFVKQFELPGDQWAFLFEGDAEQVVVAWNESASLGGSQLILSSDAPRIETVDIMGNAAPAPALDGRVLWPVEATPRYLVLRGAKTPPRIAGVLAGATGRFAALPGQPLRLTAQLSNPLAGAREFDLSWRLPKQFGGQTVEKKITVAPGATQRASVEVPIPADYQARFGSSVDVALNYRVAGTPWNGTLLIPVEMGALALPAEFSKTPTFVLDSQNQVTNLTEADPNTEYLLWKNKADLSAQVFVARADGALKVRVIVRDDAFYQTGEGALWNGDSVQIGLQVPGQSGAWKWTVADVGGVPRVNSDDVPAGFKAFAPALQIARDGSNRTYEFALRDTALGLSAAPIASGVRFNLLVNDNDGRGRKGYIAVAPGFGQDFDATQFPLLVAPR